MNSKNLLISKMKLYGDTQTSLADALGISLCAVNQKINGRDFTQSEIITIRERYHLTAEEVEHIFLARKDTEGEHG